MAQEEAVLKLVHPGGFTEVHRRPVAAAEVMARNPRHFVTRPDVFRFPWIVVRPESMLVPGQVFYVVPARTLHRLIHGSPPEQLRHGAGPPEMRSKDEVEDTAGAKPGIRLKPCLKKEGSSTAPRRRRRLHVAFMLPCKEEDNASGDVSSTDAVSSSSA